MKKGFLFQNARIVDESIDEIGSLIVIDGLISDFGNIDYDLDLNHFNVIDCQQKILIPGIIDIQVHFREPGQEHKETLETGMASAAVGGVTTVVCQPNTSPAIDNIKTLDFVLKKSQDLSIINLHCYAAATKNIEGKIVTNIEELAGHGAVGFTDDGRPVYDSLLLKDILERCSKIGRPFAQHAEDLALSANGSVNRGYVSKKIMDLGIPNASEYLTVKRDIEVLRSVKNAHYHLLHVSTKEALNEIRIAKKQGLNVTCEVTPHHFTLNEDAVLSLGPMAKMNPPLRSEEDRMAMLEGLEDGTIDCIATDHAPHDPSSKECHISKAAFGIVGLETLLPLSLNLYNNKILSFKNLIKKLTSSPAKIINQKRGLIKKGYPADLALIDIEKKYKIDVNAFSSKSKNSPFHGMLVNGSAILVMSNGKIVHNKTNTVIV